MDPEGRLGYNRFKANNDYRESIRGRAGPIEGKSPNKHNKIFISVEPLEPEVIELIRKGTIFEGLDRKEMARILREYGWDTDESRKRLGHRRARMHVDRWNKGSAIPERGQGDGNLRFHVDQ